MKIRAMLVLALGAGLAIAPGCKKKEDKAQTGAATPPTTGTTGGAAAKPTEEPPKPAKMNPKTGEEAIAAYQECTGYINGNKLDDFKAKCIAEDYKGHEVDGMELSSGDALVGML